MKDFYINHLHFKAGDEDGEYSVLISKEAIEEYSLHNFGELPISIFDRISVANVMVLDTIKYTTDNKWRKATGLKKLKQKIRRIENG